MTRSSLLVIVSLAGCVDRLPVTAPGTMLFEWDLTKATRTSVRTATIGARKTYDKKVHVTEASSPFTVDLHIEAAEIDFEEDGKKVHHVAPVLLRAKLASNAKWEVSGKCGDGPHYKMPSVGAGGALMTPPEMVQECSLRYHLNDGLVFTSTYRLGTLLQIYGDGEVSVVGPKIKVE